MRNATLDKLCRDGQWSADRVADYLGTAPCYVKSILSGRIVPPPPIAREIFSVIVPPALWSRFTIHDLFNSAGNDTTSLLADNDRRLPRAKETNDHAVAPISTRSKNNLHANKIQH
jgi:hypothetical protein